MTLAPGLHPAVPAEAYHSDPTATPSLSASIARVLLASSPAHARAQHPRLNPNYVRQEEERFDIGRCAHSLLLEGEAAVEIIDAPGWRQKWAQEERDKARAHGRIPLLGKHYDEVKTMVDSVAVQLAALEMQPIPFTDGLPEQTIVWQEDGVSCRARLDWLHTGYAAVSDLKTSSRTANPDRWSRTLYDANYDVQASFYRRAVKEVTGVTPEFYFVVVESTAPYALSVISLSPEGWALADAKVDYAIKVWRDCLASDNWPSYPTRVAYADPPGWAEAQWLEKTMREAA
jgi:hypothetical protein